jgi:cytochrome c-type biogenesis protein CcmH/NrfG
MRPSITNVVMAIVIDGLLGAALAGDAPAAMAEQALAICQSVERMPAGDTERKLARLADGLRMSEAAVAADDGNARAHLAVCCNLGKQLDLTGLSLRAFGRLRRMQAEVERAAALAPDDPDVLIARGEILRRTPVSLGGDRELGRALLRRAVELYPDHVAARLYLARAMADDRAPDARTRVSEAVAAAKRCGAAAEQSEAEELLASLRD